MNNKLSVFKFVVVMTSIKVASTIRCFSCLGCPSDSPSLERECPPDEENCIYGLVQLQNETMMTIRGCHGPSIVICFTKKYSPFQSIIACICSENLCNNDTFIMSTDSNFVKRESYFDYLSSFDRVLINRINFFIIFYVVFS